MTAADYASRPAPPMLTRHTAIHGCLLPATRGGAALGKLWRLRAHVSSDVYLFFLHGD